MTIGRWHADAILLFAAFLWGFGNVSQKLVMDDLGPLTAVGFRCAIATIVVLPLLPRERARGRRECAGLLRAALPLSVLFILAAVAQQTAFISLSVTNGSFLITTTAVMTPLAVWALYRAVPSIAVWLAVAITLCGAFLMAGAQFTSIGSGDLLVLLSASLYALWCVLLGDAVKQTGRPVAVTLIQFAMGGAVCIAAGLLAEAPLASDLLSALPHLMMLGGISTGVAFLLQAFAQQHTPPSEAAILTGAESVFGMFGGIIFLGELPSLTEGSGAFLIVGAIVLVQIAPVRQQQARIAVGKTSLQPESPEDRLSYDRFPQRRDPDHEAIGLPFEARDACRFRRP